MFLTVSRLSAQKQRLLTQGALLAVKRWEQQAGGSCLTPPLSNSHTVPSST